MKKKLSFFYLMGCLLLFIISIKNNEEYFYRIMYDDLTLYQIKQVLSVLVLYMIGYLLLKAVQHHFSDCWVLLLSLPCGAALWVFASQFLFLANITYMMHRVFIVIGIALVLFYGGRKIFRIPLQGRIIPDISVCMLVIGTAFLVSTGYNYVNMNYDSYLYFANYGKMMAVAGDYREWNSRDAFVITNIGQFLPILNSYAAFWGLEYCLSIQSFFVINMFAIFGNAVYKLTGKSQQFKSRIVYTILFTFALASCTCVVVFANWMLSNAFIMFYLMIAVILGMHPPQKFSLDYVIALCGSSLAITLLRKDGIVIVCFLFVGYCCNKIMKRSILLLCFAPSVIAQLYYIGYVRLFLRAQTITARGTSIINNKFIMLMLLVILLTILFVIFVYPLMERWFPHKIFETLLLLIFIVVIAAILLRLEVSINHIDAILRVLSSSAYGFSIIAWLTILAISLVKGFKIDYGAFVILGYCMLIFLIYWNKDNTTQGIDNSGMRAFVQIVPMIYYWGADKLRWLAAENWPECKTTGVKKG